MIDLRDVPTQEQLLGRRIPEILTSEDRRAFTGQRVMITGAGGSVGSELARQIARCGPARLTLFEQSEYNLFRIEEELAEEYPDLPLDPILGDVRRRRSIRLACRTSRPHVIYHTAAYKHVTMTERALCPAIEANVLGALAVARAAEDCGARLVLISSDKAAQARSVMGATKRLAELTVVTLASATFRPVVVRFGNILGSSGSVVEVLLERARHSRPLLVTHPDATRYFMTAQEAVSLVMKADLLGRAGETYWLDMGGPVRLMTLVQRLVAMMEREGYPTVPIKVVGLRPGEKLHEELTTHGLELCRTPHQRIWTARQAAFDGGKIRRVLRALRQDIEHDDAMAALSDLSAAVPEFEASPEAWKAAAASSMTTSGAVRPPTAPLLQQTL
ncbi:MAG TPA: polysaccharide biosynthesis protein [Vicinamibacterales bacterium]